ncbi:putative dienelactone hydrolase [Actinomadura coerulea]|uniref:Putative dienelactone hydrolase n=1 Tax=Actinomadura coerulea TaxID=46159 RepID=A0A7X0FYA9_9ACTN|nr:lipase [Actinomadura coerulea]MBB6395997.1 putative dienelactone hydrolase [Actinomadura coerulea]GGQ30892.1 lipase [Actinomadura coerulea]
MRSSVPRRLLAAAAVLPLALSACGTSAHATKTAAAAPAAFELPRPTGPHQAVGTTELHLVDAGRADPWVPGRTRELMVSVWYPATRASGPKAPYLRPGVAEELSKVDALGVFKAGTVDWAGARTHAAEGAPADARRARPVVLYSPGFGVPRALGTTIAEELASRGYVVVTVDHTYETAPVEFPGGRVELQRLPPQGPQRLKTGLDARVKDTRLVLDRLAALRAGRNPDAEGRTLPSGLGRSLDLSRVGMFGHSAGGIEAAEAMRTDRRVDAGIDMDGTMQYAENDFVRVAETGLDRPFMLMGAASGGSPQTHLTTPSWGSFWNRSTGWKRDLNVPAASHYSYTDVQAILPALDGALDVPAEHRTALIGTVDPERMTASVRAYVTAFFDRALLGRHRPVLDRPSPRHPDVRFIR